MSEPIQQFRVALQARGIVPPSDLIPDGKLHRCDADGKRGHNDAAYLLHLDGVPAGGFENWRDGLGWQNWRADSDQTLTPAEQDEHRAKIESAQRARAADDARTKTEARERAARILAESMPCTEHAYLTRKGIKPHGARVSRENLVLPVRDSTGVLHSLQFTGADGVKKFLKGGRTTGCYFSIGKPGSVLCICEGFATAASIHETTGHAVAAAFSAGNLLPVSHALRAKYPEAKLILCADDDTNKVGIAKANEAARAVGGVVVLPDFGAQRPDGVTDFNDLHQHCGADAVLQQIAASLAVPAIKTEPEPLRRPLPPAEDYPLDALGPILGNAARRIHAVVGAPAAMVGQSLLAAASLAVQHHADVEIDGRREPISLWCMTIGASGERKSGVDQQALKSHREHERAALEIYKRDKLNHDIAIQAHEAASRAASKGKDADDIESRLHTLGPPPEVPLKPLLVVGSPTIEGIHKQFIAGLPSLGLFHDDAGEFLGGHSMSAENRTKTASGLSRLWDCGEFDRIRAGDGAEKHHGKRLALHLMLQPVIAETVLSDDVLTGQGFLARCLMTWPASTMGNRQYVQIDLTQDPALIQYWRVMGELLRTPPALRHGTRNEIEPRQLTLTLDAKQRWLLVYAAIETDMGDGGAYASVRAWASKASSMVLRMAAVLTLVERPDAGVIQAETIDRAALLMNHYLAEAIRIVGTNSVPPVIRHAEQLLEWCHAEHITLLHSRAAMQFGPNSIRTLQAFNAAVGALEQPGWASSVTGGAVIDGAHRKRVWTIRGAT